MRHLNVLFVLLVVANLHQCYASTSTSMQINANSTSSPSTNYARNSTTTTTATTKAASNENHTRGGNYKLPTWFNFDAYKQFYGKSYKWRAQNELHKRIYLNTSVRVFEQRALFRAHRLNSLASVNELSDLTSEQLLAFKQTMPANSSSSSTTSELPDCCSYDQVYARIIELLERATSVHDLELSGALVAELECARPLTRASSPAYPMLRQQKPLVFDHIDLNDDVQGEGDNNDRENKATAVHFNGTTTTTTTTKLESIGQSGRHLRRLVERPKQQQRHREAPPTIKASDDWPPNRKLRGHERAAPPAAAAAAAGVAAGLEEGVSADLVEAVRLQVAQQLSSKSEFGRQLNRQLSDYFGQPVEIRARPATMSGSSATTTTTTSMPTRPRQKNREKWA